MGIHRFFPTKRTQTQETQGTHVETSERAASPLLPALSVQMEDTRKHWLSSKISLSCNIPELLRKNKYFCRENTKSLSENQNFVENELSTSQMKESQIIFGLLFPTHQQAAGTIEPGMGAFDHPAPRPKARGSGFILFLLPATANVSLVVMGLHLLMDYGIIVASVQTQMLGGVDAWLWAKHDEAIEGGTQQFHVMAIGPINDDGQRNACPISQKRAFDSLLAAIGGIGSGRGVSERGFGHRSVHGLPFPLDADQLIIVLQTGLPESFEDACPLPLLKAIVNRRTGSQFSWQGIPLDARAQHVNDSLKGLPISHAGPTPFGMGGGRWNQGLHSFPQLIADFPGSGSWHCWLLLSFWLSLYHIGFRISSKCFRDPASRHSKSEFTSACCNCISRSSRCDCYGCDQPGRAMR